MRSHTQTPRAAATVPSDILVAFGSAGETRGETSAADLSDAYKHCEAVCRHFGRTYHFSTRFFPAGIRPSVHALYAWVRYPDEWVDNPGELTREERLEKLRCWRASTTDAISGGLPSHPVLAAWADTVQRHSIPGEYLSAFLDAMETDLTVTRYETFDDLKRYTYGSASVVGLMMCRIAGVTDFDTAAPHAESLGLAMQLTNFLRDTGEDWRQRGRIYLPLEDLRRFGVTESDLDAGRVTEGVRALVRFEIERARKIYEHADAGMKYLPQSARLPVRLARVLYSRILDRIERNDCDVLNRRARVPDAEKLAVLLRLWIQEGRAARANRRV